MNEKIEGKVWYITDEGGRFIHNIDTDQIFHNSHLAITDLDKMGEYAFGNLKGWENFPKMARPGDIIVAGENFGAGSSRQQAVDCFRSLGVSTIIAKSFASIYERNAISSAFLLLLSDDVDSIKKRHDECPSDQKTLRIDLSSWEVYDAKSGVKLGKIKPLSRVEKDILEAGGIFEYGKKIIG